MPTTQTELLDLFSRVVLRGPSTFVIAGTDQGHLEMGELTAKLGPETAGFKILTPKTTIVDLGTQFGVRVPIDGEGVVQVFEGAVEMFRKQSDQPIRLAAGSASSLPGKAMTNLMAISDFVREQLLPSSEAEVSFLSAEDDGSFILSSSKAKLTGQQIVYQQKVDAIVHWRDRDEFPSWEISVEDDGQFDIVLDFSCINNKTDGEFVIMVDGRVVGDPQMANGTGGWEIFKGLKYGTVAIERGRHAISVISRKKEKAIGLMNLRSVTLVRSE